MFCVAMRPRDQSTSVLHFLALLLARLLVLFARRSLAHSTSTSTAMLSTSARRGADK
jgi:hypothetical protein